MIPIVHVIPAFALAFFLASCPTGSLALSNYLQKRAFPVHISTQTALRASGLANVHISGDGLVVGVDSRTVEVSYGDCTHLSPEQWHHRIGGISCRSLTERKGSSKRLVWLIPQDAQTGGCVSAWDSETGDLLGRSKKLLIEREGKKKRRGLSMGLENGIDVNGPWFDGVQYLQGKNLTEVEFEKLKKKRIGIVGAGMSGLMTGLLLESVGLKNWHIVEASGRVGGRVRTVYLDGGPDDYQYQEMGPMRFPELIQYAGTNESLPITDQKLVFQLAAYLNNLNMNDPKYQIKFIPWIQSNLDAPVFQGGIRKPDGTVPSQREISRDPSLAYTPDNGLVEAEIEATKAKLAKAFMNKEWLQEIALNVYQAHKRFIEEGGDDWSETGYLHNLLGASLNATDIIGNSPMSFWGDLFETYAYFSATQYKTIDKGLNRLPLAFIPHFCDRISFNRFVTKAFFNGKTSKVTLTWKSNLTSPISNNMTFDYAIVSAPFSMVRKWRFYPRFSGLLTRAINNLVYGPSCKVALHFKTRFWEKGLRPIYGGCSSTDIPGIRTFCFPSYELGSSRPGVLLASYQSGEWANRFVSMTEDEYAEYTLDAMEEIFGKVVREEYTGKYSVQRWLLDPYANGAWASPTLGQHKLYIPAYFRTENNMIFIGEHTSYTQAWISSALDSALRGTVQLLLELGLVDEAKKITEEWMARWIKL